MDEHPVRGIRITAPSTVAAGQPFAIGVARLTDPYPAPQACYGPIPSVAGRFNLSPRGIRYLEHVPPSGTGAVALDGGEGWAGPRAVDFSQGAGPYAKDARPIRRMEGCAFSRPGTYVIRATDPATGASGCSNPVVVSPGPPAERLLWGDIHCQTYFSDGLRCPEELYAFARDEAFLDVFAVSDHSESLTDRQWDYFTAVANDFNAPGRFATLVGLEWTSREWGHRNVYYPGGEGPCLRCRDPIQGRLDALYAAARRHGALVVPHHSANAEMGVKWALGHDPAVERLAEIYSVWGNSECSAAEGNPRPIGVHGGEVPGQHVIDALRMGRRYGIIAGGDIHDGRPGDDLHARQAEPAAYKGLFRQGLMGVWARTLTREAVFEALWNRRVYGTSNVRLVLRFSVGGRPMGSSVAAAASLPVAVEVASETSVARIDLVGPAGVLATVRPGTAEVRWTPSLAPALPGTWCYARVTRDDGEMAWSSPVWIEG